MAQRILNFIISLGLLLGLCGTLPIQAQGTGIQTGQGTRAKSGQEKKKKEKKEPEITYPLYNGVSIGVDLWGPGGKLFGSDFMSTEISADVDLKHRYFPVVELGYGRTNTVSDQGIHYKSGAPYFRIGLDYNALYNKKHGHMLLVGVRYAATSFKYDVKAPSTDDPLYDDSSFNFSLTDDIWQEHLEYDHSGMKGSMQWLEICVGIRANIGKNFYMGWAMRYRSRLSGSSDKYGDPWYVPGFGKYGKSRLGVTYTLVYKLPF